MTEFEAARRQNTSNVSQRSRTPEPPPSARDFEQMFPNTNHLAMLSTLRTPRESSGASSPPPRTDPVNSVTFRWLNVGVVAGAVTTFSAAATATFLGAQSLVASGSYWLLGCAAAFSACSIVGCLKAHFSKNSSEPPSLWSSSEQPRVERIVRELSEVSGCKIPQIESTRSADSLGMIDYRAGRDVLIYNPELVAKLGDRELKGVIAHELEHSDRRWTAYMSWSTAARALAGKFAGFAVAAQIYSAWHASTFLGAASGIALAGAGMVATDIAVRIGIVLCSAIASRANELRTDIRAVQRTQDLGSYLSGLRKCYDHIFKNVRPFWRAFQPIGPHPSMELRERWIRKACDK